MTEPDVGMLVLAGTPIGDPADASPRLARELASADVIAAEDTRRLRRLARALEVDVPGRVVAYYEANESTRTPELVDALRAGQRVLLVTDAGMPSVSDPGYRLVAAAAEAGLPVTAVPGPSAALTALALSGLPVDRFCFEGFLPRKAGERSRRLTELAGEPRTMVFFEAPHRLAAALAAMSGALGAGRPAVVCREMTKTYEEVRRGTLAELAAWAADGVRGEVTVVVAGTPGPASGAAASEADLAALVGEVGALVDGGARLKEAAADVAGRHGVSRKSVYDAYLAARGARDRPITSPSRSSAPNTPEPGARTRRVGSE